MKIPFAFPLYSVFRLDVIHPNKSSTELS